jgi:hypothetical protein
MISAMIILARFASSPPLFRRGLHQHLPYLVPEHHLGGHVALPFKPHLKVFNLHLVLDRRLFDGDTNWREAVSDLTNPLILAEGSKSGSDGIGADPRGDGLSDL